MEQWLRARARYGDANDIVYTRARMGSSLCLKLASGWLLAKKRVLHILFVSCFTFHFPVYKRVKSKLSTMSTDSLLHNTIVGSNCLSTFISDGELLFSAKTYHVCAAGSDSPRLLQLSPSHEPAQTQPNNDNGWKFKGSKVKTVARNLTR